MISEPIFESFNSSTYTIFKTLSDEDGLPFPLYLKFYVRVGLALSLVFTLVQGARLRKVIISYIKSPETKLGPINYLILVDQINGLFLATSIIMRTVFIISPVPMSTVFGNNVCNLANFVGAVYIGSACIWSCYISLFRVLFINAQNWLKNKIGVNRLLYILLVTGYAQILTFATLFLLFDTENSTMKMCSHLSDADLKIIDAYQVNFKKINIEIFVHSSISSKLDSELRGPGFQSQ